MTTLATRRPTKAPETITLGHLLAHQFPPREPLVGPFLRQGESLMLWSAPGTGKTLLVLTLAVMVAGGGSVLGWTSPRPRKVLLVDGEMAAEDLQARAELLIGTVEGIDREAAKANLVILSRTWQRAEVAFPDLGERDAPPSGGRKAGQDVVFDKAREVGAELVILDNFATLAEVADENDAAAFGPTLAFLLRLKAARMGCILVHHSGKGGESYRGSSRLATTFEVILGLKPLEAGVAAGGAAFRLDWTKYRREPCEAVRAREVRLETGPDGQRQWAAAETMDDDVRRVVQAVETCAFTTQRAVAKSLGWDASKVCRLKVEAIKAGRITEARWKLCLSEAASAEMDAMADANGAGGEF